MQPGKRSSLALCQSDSLIQLPSWLLAPSAGMGIVSLWFLVTITVLLSTRATSFGSVRANQLKREHKSKPRTDEKSHKSILCRLKVIHTLQQRKKFNPVPVFVFGKLLDHPFLLQTCEDVGCFLRRSCHHVHIGRFTFIHRSLHKLSYCWG